MPDEKRRIVEGDSMPGGCFPPPYYPDEDRQLAGELMEMASQLMEMASKILKPDHYWKAPPPPPIMPMDDA